jgi:5-methylcytosine-specific restriction endonuclease McrA
MTDTSSWSSLNPRTRARLRLAVLARDEFVCQLRLEGCVLVATHADHVNRRETHGDGLDNLQAACKPCNLKKGQPKQADPKHDPPSGAWW